MNLLSAPETPLCRVQFSLSFPQPFENYAISASFQGDVAGNPNMSWEFSLMDNRPTQCGVAIWNKPDGPPLQRDRGGCLEELFQAFWKPEMRTGGAGIPDLKRKEEVAVFADATLLNRAPEEVSAILVCDLDNFKQYNDAQGSTAGDSAIRKFGAVLEACAGDHSIILHNSGDKFVLFCPTGGALAAVQFAHRVGAAVRNWMGTEHGLGFGVSTGIVTTGANPPAFKTLIDEADKVLKIEVKDVASVKGSARFGSANVSDQPAPWPIDRVCALAKCLVKSAVLDPSPFANVWLNALSATVEEAWGGGGASAVGSVNQMVREFIEWMKPMPNECLLHANYLGYGMAGREIMSPGLSDLDCAFAIVHGIYRLKPNVDVSSALVVRWTDGGQSAGVFLESGETVWVARDAPGWSHSLSLGITPHCMPEIWEAKQSMTGARAVLIKIGHETLRLPSAIFSTVITVDDRPTSGGGLPDFWEVTITWLVAHIVEHPRVEAVFVLGDQTNGARTVVRLKEPQEWRQESDEMSERLALPRLDIEAAATRLEGRVSFPENEGVLVETLATILDSETSLQADREHLAPLARQLRRRLDSAPISLGITDGCRVATLADAYPTVLEIVRNSSLPTIRDQAGRELRELVDFKVVLFKPEQECVPAFYRSQEEELENYFKRAFLDVDKLFGKALRAHEQIEVVRRHLINDVLSVPERAVATRRAILIIPQECGGNGECRPLGLTSIRVIPRFVQNKVVIGYSFTWRTVEALVGFPYSLYGSIRFGQHFTEDLRNELHGTNVARRISMGEVSYIAHSLHMFTDEYGQRIARQIVHEASD